LYLIKY